MEFASLERVERLIQYLRLLPGSEETASVVSPMYGFCALSYRPAKTFHLFSDSYMTLSSVAPALIAQPTPRDLALSGTWTARGIGAIEHRLASVRAPSKTEVVVDGTRIEALDTAGAWVLQKQLLWLRGEGIVVTVRGLRPEYAKLLEVVAQHVDGQANKPAPAASHPPTKTKAIKQAIAIALIKAGKSRKTIVAQPRRRKAS